MMYNDIPRDFVDRTWENLAGTSPKYEITQLINSLLGLIVVPVALMNEELKNHSLSRNEMQSTGWPTKEIDIWRTLGTPRNGALIEFDPNCPEGLFWFVKHMRDSIAHFDNLSFQGLNNQISAVTFEDKYTFKPHKDEVNFRATFTISDIKTIVCKLAITIRSL